MRRNERGDTLKTALRVLCALALASASAGAQTYTVTNDDASGPGSLYEAVSEAASSPGSSIDFSGTDGDIALGSELSVSNGPTISAAGTTALNIPDAISIAGTLTLDMGGADGAATGAISDASPTGAGALVVQDSSGEDGVLTLTNASNSYSGGTAINSGTLSVYGDGALGATTGGIAFDGGTLQAGGGDGLVSGRTITLYVGGGTFDTNGIGSTLSGVIGGGGGLTVEDGSVGGGGSLTLTNADNSYTGGTTLDGGVLRVSADGDLGSIIGGLTFNGGTLQAYGGSGLTSARTVTLNAAGGVFDADGVNSVLNGGVGGVGGLTVTDSAGGGTLTLTDAGNTYSGGTTLNSGTLIVSADGDLGAESGLLTFNGGTLQAGADLAIARSIYLTGSGGVFNANGLSTTLSGVVGGTGGLTLEDGAGGGTLALTNSGNTYFGGTAINSGTLSVSADGDLGDVDGGITFDGGVLQASAADGGTGLTTARSIELSGNGTFDANGLQSELSGTVSGGGQLTFVDSAGGGAVELSGANSYTGGTVIGSGARVAITNGQALGGGLVAFDGGVLQAAAAGISLPNELVLSGAGTLDAYGTDLTVSGAVSGTDVLTLTDSLGGGQIALQGANASTGGLAIEGAVTVAADAANVLGAGAVTMTGGAQLEIGDDQTVGSLAGDASSSVQLVGSDLTVGGDGASTAFAGTLSDDGGSTLTKTGAGVFTLSGPWSVGSAVVSGGTLALGENANDAGSIAVEPGAVFALNGFSQTGAGSVVNNGTLTTGAETLTAGGYSGSGILSVSVLSSGANLRVTGTADVADQTLVVTGRPAAGDYTIVQAGALTGIFSAIDVPGGYADEASYSGTELTLDLIADTYTQAGQSPNQAAVGAALNAAVVGASSDLAGVLTQLSAMPSAQLNQALDQIGPVSLAAMSGLGDAAAGLQSAALGQRMSGLQGGALDPDGAGLAYFRVSGPSPQGVLLADGIGDSDPWALSADDGSFSDSPLGFFAAATDATGRLDSIDGASGSQPGYSFDAAGGLVGGDYRLDDQTAVGVFLGYIDGAASVAGGGSVDSDSLRGGGYLTALRQGLRTDVSAGAAYDLFSTSRDMPLIDRTATASSKGSELDFDAQESYDLAAGSCVVAPFVGASYDQLTVGAFNESGAGSMDLSVARQLARSTRSDLGVKVSRRFSAGGLAATPFASLGWGHEFADQSRAIDAQFSSGAGGAFSVQTADAARDAALIAAGVDVAGRGGWDARLAYSGDVRSDFAENSFSGSLRVAFSAPDWIQ